MQFGMPRFLSFAASCFLLVRFVLSQDDLGIANGRLDLSVDSLVEVRASDGQYHWGGLTYRYRVQGESTACIEGDTAANRAAIRAHSGDEAADGTLASAVLANTLPPKSAEHHKRVAQR